MDVDVPDFHRGYAAAMGQAMRWLETVVDVYGEKPQSKLLLELGRMAGLFGSTAVGNSALANPSQTQLSEARHEGKGADTP